MLFEVPVEKKLEQKDVLQYASFFQRARLRRISRKLQRAHVVHLNATAQGGGVAEILESFIPYSHALGVSTQWYAIDPVKAGEEFFRITDEIRDGLQGKEAQVDIKEWQHYATVNREIMNALQRISFDVLVLHDWQPAYAGFYLERKVPKIFVSHADTSEPYQPIADAILQAMKGYDLTVFSNAEFVYPKLPKKKVRIVPPAIDPLVEKQRIVPPEQARAYLSSFGIPEQGPLIVQVSRFDIWKNPFGVVEAFQLLQKKHPDAALALVGLQEARDNPESARVYRKVAQQAKGVKNTILFFDPTVIGGSENITEFTMMAQNAADIVVQNSKKEGFGLTVTEAMWKEKPVIGGPASGIYRQITHGKNGYIAKTPEELARWMQCLLDNPKTRKEIGKEARKGVAKQFLMPRFVLDYFSMYRSLL